MHVTHTEIRTQQKTFLFHSMVFPTNASRYVLVDIHTMMLLNQLTFGLESCTVRRGTHKKNCQFKMLYEKGGGTKENTHGRGSVSKF